MTYTHRFSRPAESYLRRLDRQVQRRVAEAIRALCDDPWHRGTKPLTGYPHLRAVRVGGWRVVYSVDETALLVLVDVIAPRGEVYRRL